MRTGWVFWGVLIGCLLCIASGGVAATDHGSQYQLQAEQPAPDTTVTRIDLQSDGDAIWTIRFRTRLRTDQEIDDYESFQADFAANTSRYLSPFKSRMTGVVAGANRSFDREMQAVNFAAKTDIQEVPRRWGVVTFRFQWETFAADSDDRLVAGDVFTGGFYITDDDTLEISLPDSHTLSDASPPPDKVTDGVLRWTGSEDFTDSHPRVVAQRSLLYTLPGEPPGWVVAGVVVAFLVWLAVHRKRESDGGDGEAETDDQAIPSEPTTTDVSADSSAGGDAVEATDPVDRAGATVQTNEEQVIDLLVRNNGQMKQAEIGMALDWSESKTSRVLSKMAADGRIEKLRIGRENVIRRETS